MTDVATREAAAPRKLDHRVGKFGVGEWSAVLVRVLKNVKRSNISLIAAGVAFYALLAAFPALAAIMALAGLFTDPDMVVTQLESVAGLLPDEAAAILISQANGIAGAPDDGLSLTLWLGVIFAIFVSMRATTGLIHGLNQVFSVHEERGLVKFWATVILLTATLLVGGLLLLLLMVGLPTVLAFVPLDIATEHIIRYMRWFAVALLFITGLTWLYRWGPCRERPRWQWFSVGAVFATLCWFAGSFGFAVYVGNFANYNETFGSLGGVIILLTWLWLSAFIILLGALIDAEIQTELEYADGRASDKGPPLAETVSVSGTSSPVR